MEQFELFSRKGAKDAKKDMKKLSELCAFEREMYFLTLSNKYCLSYFGHTLIKCSIATAHRQGPADAGPAVPTPVAEAETEAGSLRAVRL